MNGNVPMDEQETTVNLYPKKISERAEIYSSDPVIISRIKKLKEKNPDEVITEKEDQYGLWATVPRTWVKISAPRRVTQTEEQKRASAERLRMAREARQ